MLRYGTSEYELVFTTKDERPKEIMYIRGLQAFLFVLFLILIYLGNKLFDYIQYLAIFLNVFLILGNLRKSQQITEVKKTVFSYVLVTILFVFSVMSSGGNESARLIEAIILIMSSLLYIATFAVVFKTTPDE